MEEKHTFRKENFEPKVFENTVVDEKNISQLKEIRLSSPQIKNIRYKFIINQSNKGICEFVKVILDEIKSI